MNNGPQYLAGTVLSALVILAVGQLACALPPLIIDERGLLTRQPTVQVTIAPAGSGLIPSADPKADLLLAYEKLQSAYPHRITETSTNSSSTDTTVRVKEAAGPGEQRVTWTSAESGEMIETGGMFYLLAEGQWFKSDVPPLDMPTEVDLAGYFAKGLTDAQYIGQDSSIGIDAYVYSYNTSLNGNPGAGKVWLWSSSGAPYKATYKTASGSYTFMAELVYKYGIEVTITAPIP